MIINDNLYKIKNQKEYLLFLEKIKEHCDKNLTYLQFYPKEWEKHAVTEKCLIQLYVKLGDPEESFSFDELKLRFFEKDKITKLEKLDF